MIEISSTTAVLSAMITPAVLILACGSLITTTSSRLIRAVDRVRELSTEFQGTDASTDEHAAQRKALLFAQLDRSTSRSRLLQQALTRLYLALSMFVGTSVALGVDAALAFDGIDWLPLVLGFIGAGLLLWSSILLIIESRIGLAQTYAEMDFIWKVGQKHAPPELVEEFRKSGWLRRMTR
jgi:hypothetical protein